MADRVTLEFVEQGLDEIRRKVDALESDIKQVGGTSVFSDENLRTFDEMREKTARLQEQARGLRESLDQAKPSADALGGSFLATAAKAAVLSKAVFDASRFISEGFEKIAAVEPRLAGPVTLLQNLVTLDFKGILDQLDGLARFAIDAAVGSDRLAVSTDGLRNVFRLLREEGIDPTNLSLEQAINRYERLAAAGDLQIQKVRALAVEIKGSLPALQEEADLLVTTADALEKRGEVSADVAIQIVEHAEKIKDSLAALGQEAPALDAIIDRYRAMAEAAKSAADAQDEVSVALRLANVELDAFVEDQERAAEAERSLIDELKGTKQSLDERTAALIASVEAIRASGAISDETASRIREKTLALIEDWKTFGEVAPNALHDLVAQFPELKDEIDATTKKTDDLAASFDRAADASGRLTDEARKRQELEELESQLRTTPEDEQSRTDLLADLGGANETLEEFAEGFEFGTEAQDDFQEATERSADAVSDMDLAVLDALEGMGGYREAVGRLELGHNLEALAAERAAQANAEAGDAAGQAADETERAAQKMEEQREKVASLADEYERLAAAQKQVVGLTDELADGLDRNVRLCRELQECLAGL